MRSRFRLFIGCILVVGATLGAVERVELNGGWKFSPDETLGPSREFALPTIIDWLDDMGRDLLESPGASRRPQGDEPGALSPFIKPSYKDADWETTRVPHDAGIAFSFSYDLPPFDGYLPGSGTIWYRYRFMMKGHEISLPDGKTLTLPENGRLQFDCDGAMAYPMVWVNGRFAGGWPNGYMPWHLDITPFLKTDGENVMAIRVHRPRDYARWHTGVGLTRRCWFTAQPENHLVPGSVFITTPKVTKDEAVVHVSYATVKGGSREKTFTVENPRLWDVDDPHLYTLELEGETFRYGIRTIEWTAEDGFHLNGRRVQLKGFCFHQDLCSLGSVANRTAIRRRLAKAKEAGMNALRMSHYPHATDWYDLCDEMGILVMDELTDAWSLPKLYADYHLLFPRWHERDLRAMMRAHRNHPSIIIWSVGNEIWESRSGEKNWPLYQKNGVEMVRIAHQEDPTRPTTAASDNRDVWRSPYPHFPDVWGFNYKPEFYGEYHAQHPGKPIVGTETMCTQTSRGEYQFHFLGKKDGRWGVPPVGRTYVDYHSNSYGLHSITLADYEWAQQDANPFVAGSFAWTAFDYLGSPAVMILRSQKPDYTDPVRQAAALAERRRFGRCRGGIHSCPTGVFDLAGLPKDEYWLYRSRWRPNVPSAHILPHWNWPGREGQFTPVYVYSSGDEVELFVNGASQGRKAREKGLWRFRFNEVVYQPGEVKAVAYKNGQKWCEETVKTAGAPAKLELVPERTDISADGEDVGYVTLRVLDKDGNVCPTAKISVKVEVGGAGVFYAIENGDESDFTWFRDPERRTFNGLLSILVRRKPGETGPITISVQGEDLKGTCSW